MSKHINVLHVIDSAGYGGGERYILDIIKYASFNIHHWVAIPYDGPLKAQLETLGVPNIVIDFEKRFSIKSILSLVRFIRQIQPAIIHSHGYRSNIYGRMAAILSGKIHVCTVHVSLYDYIDTPKWLRRMYMIIEQVTSMVTRRFICISNAMMNDVVRLGISANKTIQIPNGVDTRRFYPRNNIEEIKQELGIDGKSPVIGTIGRMVTEKGQIFLIKALAVLKSRYPDLICLFIGDGPLLSMLKASAIELGVSESCKFVGVRDDLEKIYPVMDLFVLPSLREPFGLVLLEAMASGIPVLATSTGGPVDFIQPGENGVLVAPKDSNALAEQIANLLSDVKKRERIAAAGLKTVHDRFCIGKMIAGIEAVYRSVL